MGNCVIILKCLRHYCFWSGISNVGYVYDWAGAEIILWFTLSTGNVIRVALHLPLRNRKIDESFVFRGKKSRKRTKISVFVFYCYPIQCVYEIQNILHIFTASAACALDENYM